MTAPRRAVLALALLAATGPVDGARIQNRAALMETQGLTRAQIKTEVSQSSAWFGDWLGRTFGWVRGTANQAAQTASTAATAASNAATSASIAASSASTAASSAASSGVSKVTDLKELFKGFVEKAQNTTSSLSDDLGNLKEQLKGATGAKREELSLNVQVVREKLQQERKTLSENLFGSSAVSATDVGEKKLEELNAAKATSKEKQDALLASAADLKARLAGLKAATAQRGSALAAVAANASDIISERVGETSQKMREAAENKKMEFATQIGNLKAELGKLKDAVVTRGQETGEDALNATATLRAQAAELQARIASYGPSPSGANASIVESLKQRLSQVTEQARQFSNSSSSWSDGAQSSIESLWAGTSAQIRALSTRLQNATTDNARASLQAQIDRLKQQEASLKAAYNNVLAEANATTSALRSNASDRLGQLKLQIEGATGERKEQLKAQLAVAQSNVDGLRETAGSARANASASLADVARSISERIGEAKAQMGNATAEGRAQLEAEVAVLQDRLKSVWGTSESYASQAASAVRRARAYLFPAPASTTAAPVSTEVTTTTKAPSSGGWWGWFTSKLR